MEAAEFDKNEQDDFGKAGEESERDADMEERYSLGNASNNGVRR